MKRDLSSLAWLVLALGLFFVAAAFAASVMRTSETIVVGSESVPNYRAQDWIGPEPWTLHPGQQHSWRRIFNAGTQLEYNLNSSTPIEFLVLDSAGETVYNESDVASLHAKWAAPETGSYTALIRNKGGEDASGNIQLRYLYTRFDIEYITTVAMRPAFSPETVSKWYRIGLTIFVVGIIFVLAARLRRRPA